jgi:DNA (cytosine-5)-methyltransferase 1
MYRPEDTTSAIMKYPYSNELFMSDNCNCGENGFRLEGVTGAIPVSWQPHIIPPSTYFVRQKDCTGEGSFVTLQTTDLTCRCREPKPTALEFAKQRFKQGDTILAVQGQGHHRR